MGASVGRQDRARGDPAHHSATADSESALRQGGRDGSLVELLLHHDPSRGAAGGPRSPLGTSRGKGAEGGEGASGHAATEPALRLPKAVYVAVACVQVACGAGIVYGWPALLVSLHAAGLFSCGPDAAALSDGLVDASGRTALHCTSQDLKLHALFVAGAWASQGARFFIGLCLDRYGQRFTSMLSALVLAAGSIGFSVMLAHARVEWLALLTFTLVGAGSAGILLAVQGSSGLFPEKKSTIMFALAGCFNLSTIVFTLFKMLVHGGVATLATLFAGYGVLQVFSAVICFFVWPQRFPAAAKVNVVRYEPPDGANLVDDQHTTRLAAGETVQPSQDVWKQLADKMYILHTVAMCLQIVPAQWYIGTLVEQVAHKSALPLSAPEVTRYADLFSWIYSGVAVITPLLGRATDKAGFAAVFAFLNTCMLAATAILQFLDTRFVVVSLCLYAIGRVCLFGSYFAYIGATWGFGNFGTLAGFGLLVSAMLTPLQAPMLTFTETTRKGDFLQVNLFCMALLLLYYIIVFVVWRRERVKRRQ